MTWNKKILYYSLTLFFLLFLADTIAIAYEVYGCWTSHEGWEEANSNFTTDSESVYFNVAASFYTTFMTNKWFRPDGTKEDDIGTNLLAHPVYEGGIFIGFWTYMVINGKQREPGQWRVEHWVLDTQYKWHLMCTNYFTMEFAEDHVGILPPILQLLLDGE
jgi:hypothetical protein